MPDLTESSNRPEPNDCGSPRVLLDAFEGFRGTIYDLETARRVSAGDLRRARDRLHPQLAGAGIAAGEPVVVAASNGPVFHLLLATTLGLGAAPLLLHAQTPLPELERYARQVGATALLVEPTFRRERQALAEGAELEPADWATIRCLRLDGDPQRDAALAGVPLHPTSGTSGVPKIALRPGPCAVAEAAHYIATMDIGPGDVLLAATPMSHAYAYGMGVAVPWLSSAHVVSLRELRPRQMLRALEEQGVTLLPAVPAMYGLLLRDRLASHLAGPRLALSAGAPLPRRIAETAQDELGTKIHSLFGTTETGGISVDLEPSGTEGEVGPPMAGVEVRVRREEKVDHEGGVGRLEVRSSSMMTGYRTDEGIDRSMLRQGWFETGDLASLDSAGRLTLHGRSSDLINVFGLKVVPAEVEAVIARLPEIEAVQVYAGEHASGSQIVQAAVVSRDPPTAEMLREHCLEHLVAYKCPSRVHFLETLPLTPSGKVIRDRLPR